MNILTLDHQLAAMTLSPFLSVLSLHGSESQAPKKPQQRATKNTVFMENE
jgi:hypothetical protein